MSRPTRVLGLVPYPPGHVPSQRYRIEQWLPHLARLGVSCDLVPFRGDELHDLMARRGRPLAKAGGLLIAFARRLAEVTGVGEYDVVLLHREAAAFGPAWVERVMAHRRPIVFDFDDAIWMSSVNPINPAARWLKCSGKTRSIVRLASAVLAGNEYLGRWASQYNPATHVIPTTIDTEGGYDRTRCHADSGVPVVGWSGTRSTLRYLEAIRPALEALAARRRFRLRIIYNGPELRWPGLDVESLSWNGDREVEDLLAMDVGLMPQPDDEWARGKCGLKALQYMALGIPPVVSNSGVLPDIVDDGISGLVASRPDDWVIHIERLLGDSALRGRLGERARTTVVERYSTAVHVPRVAGILRRTAGTT